MRRRTTVTSVHNDWLTLVEPVGAFLTLPVLKRVLPNGVPPVEPDLRTEVRERLEALASEPTGSGGVAARTDWLEFLLRDVLGYAPRLRQGAGVPGTMRHVVPEHGALLQPGYGLVDVADGKERTHLVVFRWPLRTVLDERPDRDEHGRATRWAASPIERATLFCRAVDVPLALVTDSDRVVLVWAPRNAPTGHATFATSLFAEERKLLDAFVEILGLRRFFGVAERDTLPSLLDESSRAQHEVTTLLGKQVRDAVEVLVGAFSRADRAAKGALLTLHADGRPQQIPSAEVYAAAVTVMMRLVVLLAAEERRLFPVDDPIYAESYAVTTLREQLDAEARRDGEEVLEKRGSAWLRLLASFRVVFGGVAHDRLRLPPYGGSLFDPARFPWFERLAVDDRTVLAVLDALQVLSFRMGGVTEARRLSYRNLDVEQIGNVYEGLLDHSCRRIASDSTEIVLGIIGRKHEEPEVPLADLEAKLAEGEAAFAAWLEERGGPSASKTTKQLYEELDSDEDARLRAACDNDEAIFKRVRPFAGLIRADARDLPMVFLPGALYVTQASLRRDSGTAYTTKELADEVVKHALEPLVYAPGPAEVADSSQWRLRPSKELLALKVCDPAVGSGAILVAACRFLADRLVEAWDAECEAGEVTESPLATSSDDRTLAARRAVTDHCLYGVDRNPMAVEMAKLSLWLTTLAKERPFTFLDHQVRCGDSLLGVTSLDQVRWFHVDPQRGREHPPVWDVVKAIEPRIERALALSAEMAAIDVVSVRDAEEKRRLHRELMSTLGPLHALADAVIGAALATADGGDVDARLAALASRAELALIRGDEVSLADLEGEAAFLLDTKRPASAPLRQPFHWPLAFPEVFLTAGHDEAGPIVRVQPEPGARSHRPQTIDPAAATLVSPEFQRRESLRADAVGFDAFVGNPPFMGGTIISGSLGTVYRNYLARRVASRSTDRSDLVTLFFLRAFSLLRRGGCFGLVATNTIAQGDSREVGLDQIVAKGGVIHHAVPSREWPGAAAVHVAQVWVRKGEWQGAHDLAGRAVRGITPYLVARSRVVGTPYPLRANEGESFEGSKPNGMGFILEPEAAQALIKQNARNRDVLFPYLNGEDLNSRPDQSASRWVIDFRDMPLDRNVDGSWADALGEQRKEWVRTGCVPRDYPSRVAADYPEPLRIVEELVRPERQRRRPDGQFQLRTPLPQRWWIHADYRPALYAAVAGKERVLVVAGTSKTLALVMTPTGVVFSHAVFVFVLARPGDFALMQSVAHTEWAREFASSLKGDLRYTPSDCFDTFAFPFDSREGAVGAAALGTALDDIGERYHEHRRRTMLAHNEGLTKTYNRFHDDGDKTVTIVELRRLHVEMDHAVLSAYGWSDLALDHGFHETTHGVRFTVSPDARQELLDRLLELNHQRYAEEVAAGVHDKSVGKKKSPRAKTNAKAGKTLF